MRVPDSYRFEKIVKFVRNRLRIVAQSERIAHKKASLCRPQMRIELMNKTKKKMVIS